jgi:hypothetical protein
MKKMISYALCSLAALGVGTGQATAGHLLGCLKKWCCDCGYRYTVVCKPYNAFSPPCCMPCGQGWPCTMMPFGFTGCMDGSCGPGMAAPPGTDPGRPMPPATAAPGYMPPAPTELNGAPQTYMIQPMPGYGQPMPGYGQPMPGPWMQPVAFQPAYPGYYPGAMPAMMPQGYLMPQAPMMAPGMAPAYWGGPR